MQLDFHSERPLFLQIADSLEDAIFTGAFKEEAQIPSTTEISTQYRINPATVLKGMNLLVDEGLIYKKRGLGMFVAQGAVEKIRAKRQERFFSDYIRRLITEARKLGLSKADIIQLIERGYDK